jgi:hypothetical protein
MADPILDELSPTHGTVDGGTTVIISGHGLKDAESVTFDPTKVTAVSHTNTSVQCVTPEHDEGPARVWVTLKDGTKSNNLIFRFLDYRSE